MTPKKEFFGIPTNSRVGIAASVLVNDRWVETYSRLGYDLLTYKTVRLTERRCHSFPNWVFVDGDVSEESIEKSTALLQRRRDSTDPLELTGAGSFGMPSKSPDFWIEDIAKSRKNLLMNQILIVSVVATPRPAMSGQSVIDEYGTLAAMVVGAGAQVVEANLSCPNVTTGEGELYMDTTMVGLIAKKLRESAEGVPVTLKLGYVADDKLLASILQSANGFADAIVLMNGVNSRVINQKGGPVFGPGRESCGVTGAGIHKLAAGFVRRAIRIIERDRLEIKIIANGGVNSPESAATFFDSGAYAVTIASGAIFDPHLGIEIKNKHPEW